MSNAPSNKVSPDSSAGNSAVKIIECPRDAMQGIHDFIDTDIKVAYLNKLLKVGFDTIDFGSFVSPKAIPQLRDTAEVLSRLELDSSSSKLLAIVANLRGTQDAATHQEIAYLGFPFSVSETFQQRNANASIAQSFDTVRQMLEICDQANKEAVVYLSMGFGNPYGDEWSPAIVTDWAGKLVEAGVTILSLSDTTGVSSPDKIRSLVPVLFDSFRHHHHIEIGLHLHSTPETRLEKIDAAYEVGCRRFDSAIKGYGGCPMAADDLTGNLATEELIHYLDGKGVAMQLNTDRWQEALAYSSRVFL